jgi:hypothetical protein
MQILIISLKNKKGRGSCLKMINKKNLICVFLLNFNLWFVMTLKTNHNSVTIITLFRVERDSSTKMAFLRLLGTLIVKISLFFTLSTKWRSVVIHKEFFTNFNVSSCLDNIPWSNSNIGLITAPMLNWMTKPIIL